MQHRGGLTPPPAGRRRRATKPSSTTQHCLKKVYLHPTPLQRSWHTCIKRLARTGETADPCGVPRSRSTTVPSGIRIGAFNQRFTYNTTHFWSVFASTALTIRSWSTESKNLATSRSSTQFFFQHRWRHVATASRGDRFGRYP